MAECKECGSLLKRGKQSVAACEDCYSLSLKNKALLKESELMQNVNA